MEIRPTERDVRFNAVYHIATMNHWRDVVSEQFPLLLGNRNLGAAHISIATDSDADEKNLLELLTSISKDCNKTVALNWHRAKLHAFEHIAMEIVDALAKVDDSPILYFHAKGVSYMPALRNIELFRKHTNKLIAAADKWAAFLMNSDFDACGSLLIRDSRYSTCYFGGNCWMAKGSYLRSLIPYTQYASEAHHGRKAWDRFLAEMAVNRMDRMNPYAIDNSSITEKNFNEHMYWLHGTDQTLKRDPGGHFTPFTIIGGPES